MSQTELQSVWRRVGQGWAQRALRFPPLAEQQEPQALKDRLGRHLRLLAEIGVAPKHSQVTTLNVKQKHQTRLLRTSDATPTTLQRDTDLQ